MEEVVAMSKNDIERLKVLLLVSEKKLSRVTAAKRLKISDRHFRRVLKEYSEQGEKGISDLKVIKPRNCPRIIAKLKFALQHSALADNTNELLAV